MNAHLQDLLLNLKSFIGYASRTRLGLGPCTPSEAPKHAHIYMYPTHKEAERFIF